MPLLLIHFCREPNDRFPSAAADNGSGLCTFKSMKTKKLTEVLERIEAWPPEAQDALADFALDLDAGFKAGDYEPTAEELAGIERGLRDAAEGRFATPQQVETVFAKFRGEG
jgi:predicted transcriptional regulator